MGRLIDADSLKQKFMSDAFREMVDNEPTAYDVEKVVAELEEEMNDAKRLWDNDEYYTGLANGYEGAIDVVRNGGKE